MDIGSGTGYPSSALSNFAPHPFKFRGFDVASMEGFLQGLKFDNPEVQLSVFLLVGRKAKFRGKKRNWRRDQTLYFQGEPIKRDSPEYQALLDEAYFEMFRQNKKARAALVASGNAVLTHSIGKKNISETVLTRSEFCSRLMNIRDQISKTPEEWEQDDEEKV